MLMHLFGGFAALALLLAAIGTTACSRVSWVADLRRQTFEMKKPNGSVIK
jgi:hypothetical protein